MRTWIAARDRMTCGFDGGRIDAGDPVQVIEIGGLPKRFRCQAHAHGSVDWQAVQDSKASPEPTSRPERGFTRVSTIKAPFDAKLKAAGSDDA